MGVLGGRSGRGPGRSCDVLEGDCTLDFLSGKDDVVLPADKDADVAVGGGVWRRHFGSCAFVRLCIVVPSPLSHTLPESSCVCLC